MKKETPDILKSYEELSVHQSKKISGSYFAATRIQHSYISIYVLENVLNNLKPERIVELGTGWGGITSFFAVWAVANNKQLLSIDRRCQLKETSYRLLSYLESNATFYWGNVFGSDLLEYVKKWVNGKKCLIYCDNGNKLKEIETYSPILPIGSIIGCHDYRLVARDPKSKDILEKENLNPLLSKKQLKDLSSRQQFWIKN